VWVASLIFSLGAVQSHVRPVGGKFERRENPAKFANAISSAFPSRIGEWHDWQELVGIAQRDAGRGQSRWNNLRLQLFRSILKLA
jgi:hypothetical protein